MLREELSKSVNKSQQYEIAANKALEIDAEIDLMDEWCKS